jgi:hypothetical protein
MERSRTTICTRPLPNMRGARLAARPGLGRGLLSIAVTDLDALLAELRGRGVEGPPLETDGGAPPRVVLTDPHLRSRSGRASSSNQ